jgi:hypothetical protein
MELPHSEAEIGQVLTDVRYYDIISPTRVMCRSISCWTCSLQHLKHYTDEAAADPSKKSFWMHTITSLPFLPSLITHVHDQKDAQHAQSSKHHSWWHPKTTFCLPVRPVIRRGQRAEPDKSGDKFSLLTTENQLLLVRSCFFLLPN